MKAFSLFLVIILGVLPCTLSYNAYPRNGYSTTYTASASARASVSLVPPCCELDSWALSHMDEVHQMAERIKQEYDTFGSKTPWKENIVQLTGKTANELDAIARSAILQIKTDIRNGNLNYNTYEQPHFWEYRASQLLQSIQNSDSDLGQQQQVVEFESQFPVNYENPAEVKVIDGKNYVVHNGYRENISLNPIQSPTVQKTNYYNPYKSTYQNNPSSTVTEYRYNSTVIRNSDGINRKYGSELKKKWVDGKLIYDSEQPFEEWNMASEEDWKKEERKRMFWLFTNEAQNTNQLSSWQNNQRERLMRLTQQQHCSMQDIINWQRQEVERFNAFWNQYRDDTNWKTGWQLTESARLAWLVRQNSVVTPENLENWQQENLKQIKQLTRKYRISVDTFRRWQLEELNRLFEYLNKQNNSSSKHSSLNAESLRASEKDRVDELLRKHNAEMQQIQLSIANDQQKLTNISQTYGNNVQNLQNWLRQELQRIQSEITAIHSKVENVTNWRQTQLYAEQRKHVASLTAQYRKILQDLENSQRIEVERMHNEAEHNLNMKLEDWQSREREQLTRLAQQNDMTIEEMQAQILNDHDRLQQLANTYKVQVSEVEEMMRQEINKLQTAGLLKDVREEISSWQQQERHQLEEIVKQNSISLKELTDMINNDQSVLFNVAHKYQLNIEEVQNWLKQELTRLQNEGLIKAEELQEWQKAERESILKIVQANKLTIEEFEKKLLSDREELAKLASNYNIQISEIETWIKKEGERLQNLGMLQMKEELNNWQQIERQRLMNMINTSNLTIAELEEKINTDQGHLTSLAQIHQVRVEEIQNWIKNEIQKLQQEGLVEMSKLKDWQLAWRGNLTNMITERDFTVEEFHKWLLEDRARLQALAQQHNVQIEEIEQWVKNEEQTFVTMGLLKPNEKLTNWQEIERRYLERIAEENYQSTAQLEERLRQDRQLLQQLARNYSVQVEEIEQFTRKELARLRNEGQLQIDNLTAWQLTERQRLEQLTSEKTEWSLEELETALFGNNEHMQRTAFQHHTSVEEIENWFKSEVERLKAQGKMNIESLTAWQKAQQKRIVNLLQQKSNVTAEEFERRMQKDRLFMSQLSNQHHVEVEEIEAYVRQVINDLRNKGRFEMEQLQNWQNDARVYIRRIIDEHKNSSTFEEYKQQILKDYANLNQLSRAYHVNVNEVQNWMIDELQRLRMNSEQEVRKLTAWQNQEVERLKNLIITNKNINYVEFECQLLKERQHLQNLAQQYSLGVEEIKDWLRQQLVNLKTTGEIEVENLSKWQMSEQKHLIGMLLQEQRTISEQEFESKLKKEEDRLRKISQKYSVSVEHIENWMRDELRRLKDSGLMQMQQLNQWQILERQRLENWLQQQQSVATYEDFNDFLKQDKQHMANIAHEYQVTVEQVESWIQLEGARLQILGQIKPTDSWNIETNDQVEFVNNVNDVQGTTTEESWIAAERINIENLLQRHANKWSKEELKRYLENDRQHLRDIYFRYHTSINEIKAWYEKELQEMLNQQRIYSENLTDWQLVLKDRMFRIVTQQPGLTVENLREILFGDKSTMNSIADTYHLNMDELTLWMSSEINRLRDLGYINEVNNGKQWQEEERQRIRGIEKDLLITYEELYEFISNDAKFEYDLAQSYGITVSQLAPVQGIEITKMRGEGLFDQTELIQLQDWQKIERDRLYNMIKTTGFSSADLKNSSQGRLYNDLALQYGISVQELKDWLSKEYTRINNIANYYRMTKNQLETFRQEEIDIIIFINHRKLLSLEEQKHFEQVQFSRTAFLERKSGKSGTELIQWRRTLYLLSQGLIPINFEQYGGHETSTGSTKRTGYPKKEVSKDRGDQPSHDFEQEEDFDEPGLAGDMFPYGPSINDQENTMESKDRLIYPNEMNTKDRVIYPGEMNTQPGYRYSKTQTKYNAPSFTKRATDDTQQQQQEFEYVDNVQQQQQTEDDYSMLLGQTKQVEDFGQQQVVEDSQQQIVEDLGQVESIDFRPMQKSEKQKENVRTNTQKVEVTSEPERPGFFTRLKTTIFG